MNDNYHLSLIPVIDIETSYSAPQTWGRERERLVTHRDCYFAVYVTGGREPDSIYFVNFFFE